MMGHRRGNRIEIFLRAAVLLALGDLDDQYRALAICCRSNNGEIIKCVLHLGEFSTIGLSAVWPISYRHRNDLRRRPRISIMKNRRNWPSGGPAGELRGHYALSRPEREKPENNEMASAVERAPARA